jgi:hypothetical protein
LYRIVREAESPGLAADDSILVLRDRGTRDLYAFDREAP